MLTAYTRNTLIPVCLYQQSPEVVISPDPQGTSDACFKALKHTRKVAISK